MSKVTKDNHARVEQADILRNYLITQEPRIGTEVENIVLTRKGGLISAAEHRRLDTALLAGNVMTSEEPLASIFELKTGAHRSSAPLIAEMNLYNSRFESIVRQQGYEPHRLGYIGHVSLKNAMAHAMPNERADTLLEYFIATGQEMCARQPVMTASVHLSLSYADIDHAYEISKLLMVLTPPLTALCENTGRLFDGEKCGFNPSTTIRLSQRDGRGGISPVIAAATNPRDLMVRQAQHIFTTPMMMHNDASNIMRITDAAGRMPTLENLRQVGLNTVSNALLSESMQYHLLKFTSLRDKFGHASGKRLELRFADNGPFQHDLLALLAEAITYDEKFRNQLTRKLASCGLDPYHPATGTKVSAAMADVAAGQPRAHFPGTAGALNEGVEINDVNHMVLSLLESKFGSNPVLDQAARLLMRDDHVPVDVSLRHDI